MTKNKTRVCIFIDKKLNEKFKKRYPQMLSRYVEKCIKDGLKNEKNVLDAFKSNDINFSIFSFGGDK